MSVERGMCLVAFGAIAGLTIRVWQLRKEVRDLRVAHTFTREAYEAHRADDHRHAGQTFVRRVQ